MRLRLVFGDDGHWYAIPADKRGVFEDWVESESKWVMDEYTYTGEDFEKYRLNMHPSSYTFTDLQEDS